MNGRRWVGALLVLVMATTAGHAVIMRLTPLDDMLKEAEFIFTARVDSLDPARPSTVLVVEDALKGKAPFARMPVNLTGDAEAKKLDHSAQLVKRLAPKLPVVVFVVKQDQQYVGFGYTNGTWFQMTADATAESPVWRFTHCEPYFRRTFKGTTEEMKQTIADGLSGKKKPPAPDVKEKPGLGPEVESSKQGGIPALPPATELLTWDGSPEPSGRLRRAVPHELHARRDPVADGPLFAVIPSVAIGGLLSLLAMLFPAVFGGLTGQLRRWMAVISVFSLNSTLYFLHDLCGSWLQGSWWGTATALWVVMTCLTALGMLWAWRRQQAASAPSDSRMELLLLVALSGVGVMIFGVVLSGVSFTIFDEVMSFNYSLLALPWSFVLALWVGIWVATGHVLLTRLRQTTATISTEGVMLAAVIPASLLLGLSSAPASNSAGLPEGGRVVQSAGGFTAHLVGEVWTFSPDGSGMIVSSPLVHGDRVYAAAAHGSAFRPFGKLYCLDRATGKPVWTFNDGGAMKQVFSSPVLADGKLYIGEGFHQDMSCKLYCLNPDTGEKLWDFTTGSHTESTPCVADGKVYFGAGDDGVYCLDAATGEKVWQFDDGLHVDSNPIVVNGRLYAGSGVGDLHRTLQVFCLDAATGQPVWRLPADLPVWGSPALAGEDVCFGMGNGNFLFSDDRPAGGLLCVRAKDGQRLWYHQARDGVLGKPAIDAYSVYVGGRDGIVSCLDRRDGRERWRAELGSAVVSSPTLARFSTSTASSSLYVLASAGKVVSLDPTTGAEQWKLDLTGLAATLLSTPHVVVLRGEEGDRRRIYFGAGLLGNTKPSLFCVEDEWRGGP